MTEYARGGFIRHDGNGKEIWISANEAIWPVEKTVNLPHYVPGFWAEDWDSPEDAKYDE